MEGNGTDTKVDAENARAVYDQYWLHARHVESHRQLFTSFFAVLSVAVLAFQYQGHPNATASVIALSVLAILSLIGYGAAHASNAAFIVFSRMAELIAIKYLDLRPEYARFYLMNAQFESNSPFDQRRAKAIGKVKRILIFGASTASVFMAFYALVFAAAMALLCEQVKVSNITFRLGDTLFELITPLLVFVIAFLLLFLLYLGPLKRGYSEVIQVHSDEIDAYVREKLLRLKSDSTETVEPPSGV